MANPMEFKRVQREHKNPNDELSTDEKDGLSLGVKALTSSSEARQPLLSVGSLAGDLPETGWPPREGICATGMFNNSY